MLATCVMLALLYEASAVVYVKGPCPDVKVVDNFDLALYTKSRWYEVARYPNEILTKGVCVTVDFDFTDNHYNFHVKEVLDGQVRKMDGFYTQSPDDSSNGIIYAHSQNITQEEADDLLPVYIVTVNYDNYVLLYDCKYNETTQTRHDYAEIFSRTKQLDEKSRMELDNFIKSSSYIDSEKFIWNPFNDDVCKGQD